MPTATGRLVKLDRGRRGRRVIGRRVIVGAVDRRRGDGWGETPTRPLVHSDGTMGADNYSSRSPGGDGCRGSGVRSGG